MLIEEKQLTSVSQAADGSLLGSATARDLMTSTIGDTRTASASIVTHRGSGGGGSQLGLNPSQTDGFVNGSVGVDNRTLGYGMNFMHELSHTTIGGGLGDSPYGAGNPGPVATRMNVIRSELNAQGGNYGQRQTYTAYPSATGGIVPFNSVSNSTLQGGGRVYPSQPSSILQHKYIKFP